MDTVLDAPLWDKSLKANVDTNCCVVECYNSVKKKPGLRFFSFPVPVRDKSKFQRWVTAVSVVIMYVYMCIYN